MPILKEAAEQRSERSEKLSQLENMCDRLTPVVMQYGTIDPVQTSMSFTKDFRYSQYDQPFTIELLARPINPDAKYSQSLFPKSRIRVSIAGYSKSLYIDGEDSRLTDKATLPETTKPIDGIPFADIVEWKLLVDFIVRNIDKETPYFFSSNL